jgi:hypothetical protein
MREKGVPTVGAVGADILPRFAGAEPDWETYGLGGVGSTCGLLIPMPKTKRA